MLNGGGGNDVLVGGLGADLISGGDGDRDAADYRFASIAVTVNLATGGTAGEAAGDRYSGIEYVYGSNFGDTITGDAGVNRIVGGAGDDSLNGGDGDDILVGGTGADRLTGGAGTRDAADYQDAAAGVALNLVTGGSAGEAAGDVYSGIEYVYGSAFADVIAGNDATNRLVGGEGADTLDGGAGNDVLAGGAGADQLIGGIGDQDAADFGDASAAVALNLATGGTGGEAAGDRYSGVEYVYGSLFDDSITGDDAINRLAGDAGNDTLNGGGNNDYLLGGMGDDVLTGGAGADVFCMDGSFGRDTISDFWAGAGRTDRLWLTNLGVTSFADVISHATDTAAGTMLDFGNQGSILFRNVTLASLNADDFIFA